MAKDYGNRRAARRNRGPHQFLVIIVTFLFGYITASFLDVQTISQWVNTQVLAQHDDEKAPTKVAQEHKQVPPKPKFEFYTLLANERGPASQHLVSKIQTIMRQIRHQLQYKRLQILSLLL